MTRQARRLCVLLAALLAALTLTVAMPPAPAGASAVVYAYTYDGITLLRL